MIVLDLSILNQKGTPMFYSDIFANRPAFGIVGRIFISTDTAQIFRDTGTSWVLIADGGSASTNIYNSDGTLTGARTLNTNNHNLRFEGGANTLRFRLSSDNNVPRILSFATADVARWALRVDGNETGSDTGANFAIRRYNDAGTFVDSPISINREFGFVNVETSLVPTASSTYYSLGVNSTTSIPDGITFNNGGAGCAAFFQNYTTYNGNATYQADTSSGTTSHRNVITFPNIGSTITINQFAGAARAMAPIHAQNFTLNSQSGTITHMAGIFVQNPVRVFTSTTTQVDNYYGILINNAGAATALTFTNRWGIYQEGSLDTNYLNGTTLIGTTTSNGAKFQVQGTTSLLGAVNLGGIPTTIDQFLISRAIQGAASANGMQIGSIVNSPVTTRASYYLATSNTATTTFTLTNLNLFHAQQGTIGTGGSVVTTQNGFFCGSLTGATNNYGFRGQIPAGANRYNLYMDGSGVNYLLAALMIGNPGEVASSLLTITSTTRGFLPPRMTTAQKNAIASPVAGLMVYDTTLNKMCVYTTAWETITSV